MAPSVNTTISSLTTPQGSSTEQTAPDTELQSTAHLIRDFYNSAPHTASEIAAHEEAVHTMQADNVSRLNKQYDVYGSNRQDACTDIVDAYIRGDIGSLVDFIGQDKLLSDTEVRSYIAEYGGVIAQQYIVPDASVPDRVRGLADLFNQIPQLGYLDGVDTTVIASLPQIAGEWSGDAEIWYQRFQKAMKILEPYFARLNYAYTDLDYYTGLIAQWDDEVARVTAEVEGIRAAREKKLEKAVIGVVRNQYAFTLDIAAKLVAADNMRMSTEHAREVAADLLGKLGMHNPPEVNDDSQE